MNVLFVFHTILPSVIGLFSIKENVCFPEGTRILGFFEGNWCNGVVIGNTLDDTSLVVFDGFAEFIETIHNSNLALENEQPQQVNKIDNAKSPNEEIIEVNSENQNCKFRKSKS